MRLRRTQEPGSSFFFLAPALSTALCLIFFLLIGGTLLLQPGIAIKAPQSPFLLVPHHDPRVVSITGSPLPTIYFDNQEVSLEELKNRLLSSNVKSSLIIKADQQAPYDLLVRVMTVGINCGFSVILATSAASS
ncbi:MAG: biopolymer transporter ExbD [Verrucomicrobia bacterium]|jgi:biopolymer transport protein ExbD|nr:MAG: biopolymer transporter ExbD [Verrucomicrobiota bacterium]MDH4469874.1 biopolymer transporter ExbD [Verrucomicrobiae bacterium]